MVRTRIVLFLILVVVLAVMFALYSGQRTRGLVLGPVSSSTGVKEKRDTKSGEEKRDTKRGDVGRNDGTGTGRAMPEVLEKMRAWKRRQSGALDDGTTTATTTTSRSRMKDDVMEDRGLLPPTMYDMAMALSGTDERRDFIAGMSRRKLCFHHIPKTGGTNFGFQNIFKVLFNWKDLENGEMPLHIGPLLGPEVTYETMGHSGDPHGCIDGAVITILRDPKERYLSAYRNSKAIGKTCVLGSDKYEEQCACCGVTYSDMLAIAFKRDAVSVTDFLQPEIIEENQMSKMVLGEEVVSYCRDRDLDDTCTHMIQHRLHSNYLLVRSCSCYAHVWFCLGTVFILMNMQIGFSEYYEDFIEKYIKLFALRDIPELMKKEEKQYVWESRNVVEVQPADFQGLTKAFDELSPQEAAHLLKYTDVDRVLYDHALRLFHERH